MMQVVLPFMMHNFFSGSLIFAGVPNSSPLWRVFSMLNLA